MSFTRRSRLVGLLASFAVVVAACGAGSGAAPSGPVVVVTTTVLGDVVANVVGDDATVEVLMPVGADPHDFQASSAQVALINDADLVVINGLLLEEGLEDVLEAAEDDGANVFRVAPLLDPIPFGEDDHDHEEEGDHDDHDDHDDEGDHDHGDEDPHVWMDPLRMAEAARLVAEELAALDDSVDWMASADAYATELAAADAEIVELLDAVPQERRKLVTNHESLGYLADRYAFEVVGVVVPGGSTLAEPSSEELAHLVATMEAEGVDVVFAESTEGDDLARAISEELGGAADVVELYTGSLGESGSGAETLVGMLTTNAERIADALGG